MANFAVSDVTVNPQIYDQILLTDRYDKQDSEEDAMSSTRTENYLELLKIRKTAEKQRVTILGGVFVVFFVFLIAFGMLDRLNGRSLFLVTALIVPFGLAYFSTWVRLEITKRVIEMIDNFL